MKKMRLERINVPWIFEIAKRIITYDIFIKILELNIIVSSECIYDFYQSRSQRLRLGLTTKNHSNKKL